LEVIALGVQAQTQPPGFGGAIWNDVVPNEGKLQANY
jgi:hypothetical protein